MSIVEHTRVSIKCDYCGRGFIDDLGDEVFVDVAEAEEHADVDGWIITENPGEDVKHFCCENCYDEYAAMKGGTK